MFTSSYAGSPGLEVGPVSLYASADHDAPGSSSCSRSARGAHHKRSTFFGCSGCSSSSFRPTTTTAVRWLGFFYDFCIVTSFINCLLILIRIYVLAIVGSDTFVCLALYSCTSHFGYIKSYSVYIYTDFCISCFVPLSCIMFFLFN